MMSQIHEGGCHCGAVRYTFSKAPELTFYCHCQDCQRTTGGPFSVELMLDSSGFEISGPMASYVVTGDSGKPVKRWFCSKCGSGIYLESEADPGYVFLKPGGLDDASWVSPDMHIYTAAKQPWLVIGDTLPQHAQLPEEFS